MRWSWKLGRVAGIDLYLHGSFLLLAPFWLIGGGQERLATVVALFGCVLLHELGHALTARRFGIGTEDITLYPIGGVARLSRLPRAPGVELLVALAGPAVNVAILAALAVVLAVLGDGLAISGWLQQMMWLNGMLAVFNLLPVFPMDGGRVLRALLTGWLGRLRATEVASGLGQVLAVCFGVWCLLNGLFVQAALAAFIYLAAGAELRQVRASSPAGQFPEPPAGHSWVYRGNGVWQLAPVVVGADRFTSRTWS